MDYTEQNVIEAEEIKKRDEIKRILGFGNQ